MQKGSSLIGEEEQKCKTNNKQQFFNQNYKAKRQPYRSITLLQLLGT